MAKRLTKKQKVENYIIKHPDMRPVDIAKKVDAAPAYIGQIRRDLAAARPELGLPQVKRGRHSGPAKKPVKPVHYRKPYIRPMLAVWERETETKLKRETLPEYTGGTTPNLFRRVLTALGLQ